MFRMAESCTVLATRSGRRPSVCQPAGISHPSLVSVFLRAGSVSVCIQIAKKFFGVTLRHPQNAHRRVLGFSQPFMNVGQMRVACFADLICKFWSRERENACLE